MRKSKLTERSRSVPVKNMQWMRAKVIWTALILPVWGLVASTVALAQTASYTWEYRYDAMRRVTGTIAPDPDGGGPLASPATRTTYDFAGRAITVETGTLTEAHGVVPALWSGFYMLSRVDYTYDALDRKTKQVSKGSDGVIVAVTQFSYDVNGRLQCSTVRMNPSTFGSLPANACVLGATGSQGPDRITQMTYDAADQLTKVQKALWTPQQQDYAAYTYTPNGKQWSVKDANGNLSAMAYDGHDRLSVWYFPSKTTPNTVNWYDYELYGYDANSNRTSLRKRDSSTLYYQYDGLNRMTVKWVPERAGLSATHTRDVFFGYDLRGLQTRARFDSLSGEGVTSTFNGFGDLVGSTLTMDGVTRSLSYQRDKNGNRIELTWMDSAKTSYGYDGIDRMKALYEGALESSTSVVNYVYNSRGSLDSQTGRFGQLTNFGYDAAGRMKSLSHDLTGVDYDVTYGLTQINPAGQITRRSTSNAAYAFTAVTAGSSSYTANGLNQYSTVGGATYSYDLNGNLTNDGAATPTTYLYDVENRLVNVTKGASSTALRYDPLGRLYETASATAGTTTTTRFLHDGDELVAEFNSAGTLLRRYAHGSRVDDPVVWYEGSNTVTARWLHTNWQGSIVAVTDNTGAAIARNKYDEYGAPETGNMGRFQYTGQALIPEIGLYYYKARIYSPALGRFLQTDPIGYKDDNNLYAYVGNDPLNRTDPSGLFGMGTGWDDLSWKRFNAAQQKAAEDMEGRADKLEAKADKLDARGKNGAADLRAAAGRLRDGARDLRSDGSDGKVANAVDSKTYVAKGGTPHGAARAEVGGNVMWVNRDNRDAWGPGNAVKAQWSVGHESLHSGARLTDMGFDMINSYAFGDNPQSRRMFEFMRDKSEGYFKPDNLMDLVYPGLAH